VCVFDVIFKNSKKALIFNFLVYNWILLIFRGGKKREIPSIFKNNREKKDRRMDTVGTLGVECESQFITDVLNLNSMVYHFTQKQFGG